MRTAPELTGRTGHTADQRADLYSFGAMAYEWATGRAPFLECDPLRLLHEQLAATPPAPIDLRPELPKALSDILLRLLEKEPGRRYQSIQGLKHDLDCLSRALRHGDPAEFALGERDFPARLAPHQTVGRAREIAQLHAAVDAAARGEFRAVLVSGGAGVGKTALVNEIRAHVSARKGRFVAGKFDQYDHAGSSATFEALRALGRLLLAEPEAELAVDRNRILRALGAHAAVAAAIPEFRLLLGDLPEPAESNPAHAIARTTAAVLSILRAVASAQRPLVVMLDDLQWARESTARFIETLLGEGGAQGLVVVGVYRDDELPAGHPVAAALPRWLQCPDAPNVIHLRNLDEVQLAEMLGAMLRLPAPKAGRLAHGVRPHTGGNPYDTVEFVNAMRRDRVLQLGPAGWHWGRDDLRSHAGDADVVDLISARIARLPAPLRELLEAMACVQHEAGVELVRAASGMGAADLASALDVLSEEGLVLRVPGPPEQVRLRHDRVQQAVYLPLGADRRLELHLAVARRLAVRPGMESEAASQYLAVGGAHLEPVESRIAAALLRQAAAAARKVANVAASRRMLEAALALLERAESAGGDDLALVLGCETDLHFSLCSLGALEDADAVYARMEARAQDPISLASAACWQLDSLTVRGKLPESLSLGLGLIGRLGIEVPQQLDRIDAAPLFAGLREWVEAFDQDREQARPHAREERAKAAAEILNFLGPAAFYHGAGLCCWIVREAQRIWDRHGPYEHLMTLSFGGWVGPWRGDYRTGYECTRQVLAFAEASKWEMDAAQCRFIHGQASAHWFEPMERVLQHAIQARDELVALGNLAAACWNSRVVLQATLECARTIDAVASEVRSAQEFASRIGNSAGLVVAVAQGQLLNALRGQTYRTGSFDDGNFSEERFLAQFARIPGAALNLHLRGAIAAAIFADAPQLRARTAAATNVLMNAHAALYHVVWIHWLGLLGCAWSIRANGEPAGPAPLAEIDRSLEWLAGRAADAPQNFRHMYLHGLAERAWATGEIAGAATHFDEALRAVEEVTRPWHRALITERAGRFHSASGRVLLGRALLREAEQLYGDWGASAKSALLRHELGLAGSGAPADTSQADTTRGDIDTRAVLRAAQALACELSTAGLVAAVNEVLSGVTGATRVVLAIWDDETSDWMVQDAGAPAAVPEAPHLPLSVLRYAERTREPLVLADAPADDRFARDPYYEGVARCSLLVLPIVRQGAARAVLLLENRVSRGAFNAAHLDTVRVLAGQLAVSLENARLYERLERKVELQTQQLREAQSRLIAEARRAGMAQIATNVLHNVGNVLTSVNVSARLLAQRVRDSRIARVDDAARLLRGNAGDLKEFLAHDDRGRLLPGYLEELAQGLQAERDEILGELARLGTSVDHIKNVVAMQQSYAGATGVLEETSPAQLLEDALRIHADTLKHLRVSVRRHYAQLPPLPMDRTRVMQILLNLVENACQAMEACDGERILDVKMRQDHGRLDISIADTGCGIAPGDLTRIFSHGFTTKKGGHGFGLHSCAIAAHEIGGELAVQSDGPARGATFTLRLPIAG
jgi:signal transduction histidine kinase